MNHLRPDASRRSSVDWPQDAKLPPNTPAEKLLALLRASDEMMESIFRHSRHDTLNMLASIVKSLLEAEASAIFLVDEDSPDELILSAYQLDKPFELGKLRLKIQNIPKGGMTGYVAKTGEILRVHGAQIWGHTNHAGASTEHLKSGKRFSTLGIPLRDRKGRILGVVKVDNKKGPDGVAGEAAYFDEVDEFIARVLINKLVLVLESLRGLDALRDLMNAMHRAKSLDDILNDTLITSMRLIGANRGDFVWWDANKHKLVAAAQYGPEGLEKGDVVPERSVVYEVWRTKEPALIADVYTDERYSDKYYAAHPATRSEMAVCLELEGKPIGVLNAESSKLNWFNKYDLELLQLLAQYATVAAQVIGEEAAFRGLVQHLSEHSPAGEVILKNILLSVAYSFGFDAGAIFIVDYEKNMIQGFDTVGCDHLKINPKEFKYDLKDRALVSKVARESKGYFSPNPKKDQEIHQREIRGFEINGPLVGVPLLYRDATVGVLVSWSRGKNQPNARHLESLKPFAALAGTAIALSETELQRKNVLINIGNILDQMQTESDLKKNLKSILSGVQKVGFDRVRVFEFQEESQSFVGLGSVGMNPPETVEGYRVFAKKNPYVRHAIDIWESDRRARRYDSSLFGPDPDAAALKKDPSVSWAVVPLVTNGKLYGYISADNSTTGRRISDDSLQYMTLYGALACQAIVNQQTIDLMSGSKLRNDFLRQMGHIFGTHGSSVKLIVKMLRGDLVTYAKFMDKYLPILLRINDEYLALGRRMRDFAALGKDTKLNIEKVSLEALVRDRIERMEGAARAKGIEFETKFPPSLLWPLDKVRAASAVEALLENAIKFSPPGKTVYVVVEEIGETARIIVRDEGVGIPEKEVRFVFDSFFRASNAKNEHIEGTGLGLSIVQATMELHRGSAKARNRPEGGAEFTLEFPDLPWKPGGGSE